MSKYYDWRKGMMSLEEGLEAAGKAYLSGRVVEHRDEVKNDGDIIVRPKNNPRTDNPGGWKAGKYQGYVMVGGVRKKFDLARICPNKEHYYDCEYSMHPELWADQKGAYFKIAKIVAGMSRTHQRLWDENKEKLEKEIDLIMEHRK